MNGSINTIKTMDIVRFIKKPRAGMKVKLYTDVAAKYGEVIRTEINIKPRKTEEIIIAREIEPFPVEEADYALKNRVKLIK